jgi:hypothetical protein
VSLSAPALRRRPIGPVESLDRRLVGLAATGVGGFALAGVYQLSGGRVGVPCLLHLTTGLDCPLCGSTRMAAALLRGDLGAAWAFNAPVLILGPMIGIAVGYQLLVWLLERLRLVRLPRIRISPRAVDLGLKVLVAGMLVFGVLRNL